MTGSIENRGLSACKTGTTSRPLLRKRRVILLVLAAIAGLVAANGHFVYVAVTTQPDCVSHQKTVAAGSFRAAKSSC